MAAFKVVLLLLVSISVVGQDNRYIVYFKDKAGSPYSIANPNQFLSQRAIERRQRQSIEVTEEDIPVNANYINEVKATGAQTFFSSRWMNCVLVESNTVTISVIQNLPHVLKTELVASGKKLIGGRIKKFKNRKDYVQAPATQLQLEMVGIDAMHQDGYKGEGKWVAVFDSGFEGVNTNIPFQHLIQDSRIVYAQDFVTNSGNVFQFDEHGTEVLSVMAAFSSGSYTGGAYAASYLLFVTEDVSSEFRIEEYNWLFAAEKADSAGVDVINSSLGYNLFDDPDMDYVPTDLNGKTAIVTQAAAKAIAKGMLVVCSAGNEGGNSWKYVTPPADVDGILSVGAINPQGNKSNFSSIGPTADQRIKPDVVALGSGTSVIKPSGAISSTSGTSVASPLIASLAAGLWQAYPLLTAQDLAKAIISSADQAANPDNQKGYGLPNYTAAKNFIEFSELTDDLLVFPNPSTDTIKIVLKQITATPALISIYDQYGKLLQENSIQITWINQPIAYDVSSLAAGIYFVKVKAADHSKTIRLIKL